ncbi:hypothetical protein BC830DRAFT_1092897 [Chytriomyces sp. MP71]|nr:hypothetical protein BC830DRAFT_1092897 [Chytriomyces sp. MP71]
MTLRRSQTSGLLTVPPEIIFKLAIEYLNHSTVLRLTRTSAQLRSVLNTNESLWKALTFRRSGVNYAEAGSLFRRKCFDPELASLCPHLSLVSDAVVRERVMQLRVGFLLPILPLTPFFISYFHAFGSVEDIKSIKCTGLNCSHGAPDLWMCMTENCDSVGCGRTKNQHAMLHFAANSHHVSLKINTLEVWCYQCIKWVGKKGKLKAEEERVEQIISQFTASTLQSPTASSRDIPPAIHSLQRHQLYNERRHIEREMYELSESDKVYFLSVEFLLAWRKFLLGNEMPPEDINNRSLVVAREDWDYVGCPNGLPNGLPLMNPYMAPFHDFGIVSEVIPIYFCRFICKYHYSSRLGLFFASTTVVGLQ